ncbi:MAG: hypothetical protein JWN32_1952 [Solirubrobacterales bacterium]|jgi:hypothetical protein|nr:hypothetical protein [Solirubrobacterales bacterium]
MSGEQSANGTTPVISKRQATPVLAMNIEQACEALGISWDLWREHVAPEVRIVRLGRRRLVSVAELQRFLDERAGRTL